MLACACNLGFDAVGVRMRPILGALHSRYYQRFSPVRVPESITSWYQVLHRRMLRCGPTADPDTSRGARAWPVFCTVALRSTCVSRWQVVTRTGATPRSIRREHVSIKDAARGPDAYPEFLFS